MKIDSYYYIYLNFRDHYPFPGWCTDGVNYVCVRLIDFLDISTFLVRRRKKLCVFRLYIDVRGKYISSFFWYDFHNSAANLRTVFHGRKLSLRCAMIELSFFSCIVSHCLVRSHVFFHCLMSTAELEP